MLPEFGQKFNLHVFVTVIYDYRDVSKIQEN